jgi:hypothetical protein
MKRFKVLITQNLMQAPSIFVDAINSSDAIQQAKALTNLSKFKNWNFHAVEL